MEHKRKDGHHPKRGLREGENDAPKDAEFAAAIYFGGIAQFSGDRHKELTKEKDIERPAEKGANGKGQKSVYPLERFEDHIDGDKGNLTGDHHRCENHDEQDVSPGELEPCKPIGYNCG